MSAVFGSCGSAEKCRARLALRRLLPRQSFYPLFTLLPPLPVAQDQLIWRFPDNSALLSARGSVVPSRSEPTLESISNLGSCCPGLIASACSHRPSLRKPSSDQRAGDTALHWPLNSYSTHTATTGLTDPSDADANSRSTQPLVRSITRPPAHRGPQEISSPTIDSDVGCGRMTYALCAVIATRAPPPSSYSSDHLPLGSPRHVLPCGSLICLPSIACVAFLYVPYVCNAC